MRFPFVVDAEYRGVAPYASGQRDGETWERQPKLKFEIALPDGDVETVPISRSACDSAADFDVELLQRGDEVHLVGLLSETQYGVRVELRQLVRLRVSPLLADVGGSL